MDSPSLPDSLSEFYAALCVWLPAQRWFAGKSRHIQGVSMVDCLPFADNRLWEIEVTFDAGPAERYALPVSIAPGSVPASAVIGPSPTGPALYDAVHDPAFRQSLFQILSAPASADPRLSATCGAFLANHFPAASEPPASRVLPVEQSNTSLIYGDCLFVKFYRRRALGLNPDAELTRYLSEVAGFPHVPAFGGEIRWAGGSLALATELRPNQGDAWARALAEFARWLDDARALEPWRQSVRLLGRRTGELHRHLGDPASHRGEWSSFAPESKTLGELSDLHGLNARATQLFHRLRANEQHTALVAQLDLHLVDHVLSGLAKTADFLTIRTHGDYHLGQVLCADGDFLIIDFEGEPSRSLEERRAKYPPIRDVAGMLRSFHYAAHAARASHESAPTDEPVTNEPGQQATVEQAETWAAACQHAFLEGWREAVQGSPLADERLLRYYLVEKALYEVEYELNNRPAWLPIPLRALLQLPSASIDHPKK